MKMSITILDLSCDNFQEIIKFLSIPDFGSVRRTCRSIRQKTLKFWKQWVPQISILPYFLKYQYLSLETPLLHGIYLQQYYEKIDPILQDLKFEELDLSKRNYTLILYLIHPIACHRHLRVLHLPAILGDDPITLMQTIAILRIPNLRVMIGTQDLLFICCSRRYYVLLTFLIDDMKTNINERCANGSTPLITAIEKFHNDIVDLLLKSGADVNLADCTGKVPLMAAIQVSNHMVIKLLHSHQANGRCVDNQRRSIYDYADNAYVVSMVKELYPPNK